MVSNDMIMPFQVFRAYCGERRFVYVKKTGLFDISCKLGKPKCNIHLCPIWNSNRVKPVNTNSDNGNAKSLRDINLELKKR